MPSKSHSSKIRVVDVQPELADYVPSLAVSFINKALIKSDSPVETYNYYYEKLKNGTGHVWLVYNLDELVGALCPCILVRELGNVLLIGPLGGKKFRLWADFIFDYSKKFAQDTGCKYVLAHGRKGLSSFIPNAKISGYIYTTEV